jgi:hypothetical protein
MPSTVIKRLYAAILITIISAGASATDSNHSPAFVQDPVLGLRLPVASINLDTVPEDIRALCTEIADSESWTGRQWVFGIAASPSATYYLVGGYFKRRFPKSGERLYFQPEGGGVYQVSNGRCTGDPARETFDVRDTRQIPQEVLQRLANDLVARLARAYGDADRLRAEISHQHIDYQMLSPEMQEAFKPYFAPAN